MRDPLEQFSPHLRSALTRALAFVVEHHGGVIYPVHLLWALVTQEGSQAAKNWQELKGNTEELTAAAVAQSVQEEGDGNPVLHEDTRRMLENAMDVATSGNAEHIGTEHLFSALLQAKTSDIAPVLPKEDTQKKPCPDCGEAHEQGHQSALSVFAVELTAPEVVKKLLPTIGREEEMTALSILLTRKVKPNVILLGEAGVGKTALIEGLATQIATGKASPALKNARIFSLNLSLLLSGTSYRGEFEERLHDCLDDLKEIPGAILFLDELHTVIGAGSGGSGAMDAANILKPALARGEIRMIGATTPHEYAMHVAPDSAFARRFHTLSLKEPTAQQVRTILTGLLPSFAEHHALQITDEAVARILALSGRLFPHRRQPDASVDLLDAACADAHHAGAKKLTATAVEETALKLSERAHFATPEHLHTLENRLNTHILGQTAAIKDAAAALLFGSFRLHNRPKPLTSLLFVGPSGSGKTALAKAIAREYFTKEDAFLRFDMSEFGESHSVSKLIGAPPGYVGFEGHGTLYDALEKRGACVILFDEIDKAHRDVHHLFLQLLDEGRLTDSKGRIIDVRECIVIFTANVKTSLFEGGVLGFGHEGKANEPFRLREGLQEQYSREFLARLDAIIPLKKLEKETFAQLIQEELGRILISLKQDYQLNVSTEKAVTKTILQSLTAKHTARDIPALIREQCLRPLLEAHLQKPKKKTWHLKHKDGRIVIR